MEAHRFATRDGGSIELDICFACQGLWFDPRENLQLAPGSVVELFQLLHQHRDDAHHPVSSTLRCPRCRQSLSHGFDVVKSGRYVTYRCAQGHGRFATFSSFMVEKGFVRQLTKPEIEDLARRVDTIFCTGCGAPVDIRRDHACPHCRAAFSLLDPAAVERALQRHVQAAKPAVSSTPATRNTDLADALVSIERSRSQARREEQKERIERVDLTGDLWAAGVEMVWRALMR